MKRTSLVAICALGLIASSCSTGSSQPSDEAAVSIFGPYRGHEADLFTASFEEFSARSDIEIEYTGTGSFVTDLQEQVVEAADPPDIAIIPQRGLVREFAQDGYLRPLAPVVVDTIERNYDERALELASVDDSMVAIPFRSSVKSLVWYRPSVFDQNGLSVPGDLDELESLAQEIEDEITTPWCFGLESEGSTGWVATDWTEDMLLRQADLDIYNGWVEGDIEFGDEAIESAYEGFRSLVLESGRLSGGLSGALRRPVDRAFAGLFEEDPRCVLYRQASFAFDWMPEGTTFGPDGDIDFFVLPTEDAETTPPLLLGEDLIVAFTDRPEVTAVMQHLAEPETTAQWVDAGGFTSLNKTADGAVRQPFDQAIIDLLVGTDAVVALDASDSMPPEIGTTLLWNKITEWVAGGLTFEAFAKEMDKARSADTS